TTACGTAASLPLPPAFFAASAGPSSAPPSLHSRFFPTRSISLSAALSSLNNPPSVPAPVLGSSALSERALMRLRLLVGLLLASAWFAAPALGQGTRLGPPVAPTDGPPARFDVGPASPPLDWGAGLPSAAPDGRFWVAPEFVYWQLRGQGLPPLVTAAPAGVPRPAAGTLGDPNTIILFGDDAVNDGWRPGLRLRGGLWL